MQDIENKGKLPRQIPYIVANEACERFSFYGMRNILTPFLISTLLLFIPESMRTGEAKHVFHTFVIGVYFFPLLGGWLADRFFGKYNTVLWFSIVYCIGHACLAIFEDNLQGFYFGLFLIALGSGGIKPLVASFMGDQFDKSNRHLANATYDAFYWTINFGSFFASLLMPPLLKNYGPSWAFGVPGILMGLATLFFWMGRKKYVYVPPKAPDEHSFSRVARTALLAKVPGQANWGLMLAGLGAVGAAACILRGLFGDFVIYACAGLVALIGLGGIGISMQLERARGIHTDEAVDGVRAVLRILIVFALTTPFWSLFDQKASTWIVQANSMATFGINLFGTDYTFLPAQLQALNPLFVMLLIPFNNLVLYPLLERFGLLPTPLRRMTAGIAFSGLSWIVIGTLQVMLDRGDAVSMAWQILPYALLTFGEVLVSATGLEFAYSQAPASMKGVIMSLWYLSVTIGNLWVLLVNNSVKNPAVIETIRASGYGAEAFQMYFFAAFALLAALVFGLYARRYKMTDNYRTT